MMWTVLMVGHCEGLRKGSLNATEQLLAGETDRWVRVLADDECVDFIQVMRGLFCLF
jgi:hypothetical protein